MIRTLLTLAVASLLAALCACKSSPPATRVSPLTPAPAKTNAIAKPSPAPPAKPAFQTGKLHEIDAAINQAITDKKLPGGVLWLEQHDSIYRQAYGQRAVVPATETMSEDTIFDAASLTKVIAGTPAIMLLIERGKVKLTDPVSKYVPEFAQNGKDQITIRQLLTHTSGLRPDIGLQPDWTGHDAAIRLCCAEKLSAAPDEKFIYSDTSLIMIGEVVQRVTGEGLDEFVKREVYGPLKMVDTGYNPPMSKLARIAPTEVEGGQPVRGVVHDPRSRRMNGVAGHAGLFTTAADLARYARMMLNGGTLEGTRLFKPETIRLMTSVQTPPGMAAKRGLGWDIDSPYASVRGSIFPVGGYGHTGWTGTSIWIDPGSQTFVIFLSNRNHPTEAGNVVGLRKVIATLAAEAVGLTTNAPVASSTPTRTASVLNGIDVLKKQNYAPLKGLKIGLITNHTGHDHDRNPTIDLLHQAPGVQLKVLFSPEHGIRGQFDEKVSDSTDEKTGLPIFSLYGETRSPKAEQLRGLDALVYDIQDIGCRFYTYPSTMGNCIEAAGKAGIKMFVLDRVNPINGVAVDGPVLAGDTSFVAYHTDTVRHGMTVGELARMFNAERNFKADLTVIPVEGWRRGQWFDATGLPWTNPSPNMRSLTEATLYPGVGLLETTAVSVGRGTDTPFEVVGAPYIDDQQLAAEMNRAGIPGVRFVPVRFTPKASVFKDKACAGVNIILTDREQCPVIDIGIVMAQTLHRLYPKDFDIAKFNRLLVHAPTIDAIKSGKSLAEIKTMWAPDQEKFKARRKQFLIYGE